MWDLSIVELVLQFAHPPTAFRSRGVCRQWLKAMDGLGSPFWKHVCTSCVPSCSMTISMLEKAHPRYRDYRHFSKMSLGNLLSLQHVLICDIGLAPLCWLTNVPVSTRGSELYDIASELVAVDMSPEAVRLVGSGLPLAKTKGINEHIWPTRGGRRGWRLDMIVIVRAYLKKGEADIAEQRAVAIDVEEVGMLKKAPPRTPRRTAAQQVHPEDFAAVLKRIREKKEHDLFLEATRGARDEQHANDNQS